MVTTNKVEFYEIVLRKANRKVKCVLKNKGDNDKS